MVSRYNLRDLGFITALDVVLLNRDRNPGNLLIEADLAAPMRVWAIDHERLGVANLDFLRRHHNASLHQLPDLRASLLQPAGSPAPGARSHALQAATTFERLQSNQLLQVVSEALTTSGYVEDGAECSTQLHQRCRKARTLITSWLDSRLPDLTTITRFTVGAVVSVRGVWRWIEAPLLPPKSYLSPRKQAVLALGFQRLQRAPTAGLPQHNFPEEFDPRNPPPPRLSHLGNHFHIDIPQHLPEGILEPADWIQQNRLPRPQQVVQSSRG